MARRKRSDGLLDLLFELPWWATLILGLFLMGVSGGKSPVALMFKMFAYACFMASFAGAIKSLTRKSLFASANDIDTIRAMSWREFETLIGEAYRRKGYMVTENGGGGADGGVDLILRGRGQKILVQCKQWRSYKVSVKIVREMYGIMVAERADRVIVATSGVFTQEALSFARGKPIDLIDGRTLVQLIRAVKGGSVAFRSFTTAQPSLDTSYKALNIQVAGSSVTAPACPKCGSSMVLRTARKGPNAGGQFWGCPNFPACRGIVGI